MPMFICSFGLPIFTGLTVYFSSLNVVQHNFLSSLYCKVFEVSFLYGLCRYSFIKLYKHFIEMLPALVFVFWLPSVCYVGFIRFDIVWQWHIIYFRQMFSPLWHTFLFCYHRKKRKSLWIIQRFRIISHFHVKLSVGVMGQGRHHTFTDQNAKRKITVFIIAWTKTYVNPFNECELRTLVSTAFRLNIAGHSICLLWCHVLLCKYR
jgi:hypothetical protein